MSADVLTEFIAACGRTNEVVPWNVALSDARADFGLMTSSELAAFIANGGLEQPKLINRKPWEKNPDPSAPIDVHAYSFFSGLKFGYIAFFFQPKTRKWVVKSFKKNKEPDPRNLAMLAAMRKKGLVH